MIIKRIKRSTWGLLALPSLIACSTVGGDDTQPTGQAKFALSQTTGEGTFRFIGSMDIVDVDGGGDVVDTLVATEASPPTHVHELPGGAYALDIVDGEFDEMLVGDEPACTYAGPIPNFIGCTVGDPGIFGVFPGVTQQVVIPVTFHFADEDVLILFSTGEAEFTLVATVVVDGCPEGCSDGQVCAAVDGIVDCYDSCSSDADCSGGTCTLVAEEGGANAMLLCIGGGGGECAHPSCEEGEALDPTCDECVASICAVDPFCCDVAWDALCVEEVGTVCGDECPGGCAHDVCEVGEVLDPAECGECVANICAVDPFCCESAWDETCVAEAGTICGIECPVPECAHDQCVEGEALDPTVCGECVGAVCAVDPFCCESAWDALCVEEVGTICGEECPVTGECAHDQCEVGEALDPLECNACVGAICAVDPFCCESSWDETCVAEVGSVCGEICEEPVCAHDQCVEGDPLDPAACGECVGSVCAVDPFCCESAWDSLCVEEVGSICGIMCPVPECAHDTCVEGVALDPVVCGECVANICAVDPFCCESSWDATCVAEAETICGEECPDPGECAHGQCEVGEALDPLECNACVGAICAVDPFCCETSWDGQCVGEVSTVCGETCPTCAHDQCVIGEPLDAAACGECVAAICAVDGFCCSTQWDSLCVEEVGTICGDECPALPALAPRDRALRE